MVKCEWQIVEAPRFFEAMLRGRPYYEASHITSRICGICSVGHATASLRATENALGVEISEQTELLRKLLFHGEMIDSHVLHVYMLVAPDFFGVGSVLPLAASHPEVVLRALRIKKLSGDLCAMIAGRHTHPIAMTVGGFTHLPTDQGAAGHARAPGRRPRGHGRDHRPAQDAALARTSSARPSTSRCKRTTSTPLSTARIATTDGFTYELPDYRKVTNEYLVPHSTAKHAKHNRDSYMVGALARFNNNYDQLHPRAKAAAEELGMKPIVTNPFLNTAAQAIEMVHCVEDSHPHHRRAGGPGHQGRAAVPVPGQGRRGRRLLRRAARHPVPQLCHRRRRADPGRQLHHPHQPEPRQHRGRHARRWCRRSWTSRRTRSRLMMEMLVRAYDPCISCSTHLLNVEFV